MSVYFIFEMCGLIPSQVKAMTLTATATIKERDTWSTWHGEASQPLLLSHPTKSKVIVVQLNVFGLLVEEVKLKRANTETNPIVLCIEQLL